MEIGTSCSDSLRLRAVTVISGSASAAQPSKGINVLADTAQSNEIPNPLEAKIQRIIHPPPESFMWSRLVVLLSVLCRRDIQH